MEFRGYTPPVCVPTATSSVAGSSSIPTSYTRAPMLTVDISLPDIDELKALATEGQEKGCLTFDEVAAALEEIELTKEQLEDFYTYLLDHNIELLDGESKQQAQQHRLIYAGKTRARDTLVSRS